MRVETRMVEVTGRVLRPPTLQYDRGQKVLWEDWSPTGRGDGEGAPIHMPMIRLETAEHHRMYCLMPSDNFIVTLHGFCFFKLFPIGCVGLNIVFQQTLCSKSFNMC